LENTGVKMAALTGKQITNTYKDILTVLGSTSNEGLTSSAKQIFDGEGVGSAMWVSTNLLQVGSTSSTASVDVYGGVTARNYKLRTSISGEVHTVFTINEDGSANMIQPFITKSSVTFKADGADDIVMDASNSSMKRGDGSKGNVKLGSTDVTLQKGSTDLLTAKEDGTIKFQNVSSLPSNPAAGDIVNYNGVINVGV
tara:strand:- start:265 stop:858 length:594 start_codon:yes stop_codon:yes gene_type:complete